MIDFTIEKISKKSRARLGVISTSSGKIHTPAFVPVATKGTVKGLLPAHVAELGVEVAFVNTYHLMVSPGLDALNKVGGIKAFSGLPCPLMSDSGGFQVFSLGTHKRMSVFRGEDDKSPLIKISEEGVRFRSLLGGGEIVLSPEASLEAQRIIRLIL